MVVSAVGQASINKQAICTNFGSLLGHIEGEKIGRGGSALAARDAVMVGARRRGLADFLWSQMKTRNT